MVDHLGIPLPVHHSLLEAYAVHEVGHTASQGSQLEIWVVVNLLILFKRRGGTLSDFAGIIVLIIGLCLRWRHAQRSRITGHSARLIYGHCTKGKRRVRGAQPAFDWAAPRQWWPGDDTLGPVIDLLAKVQSKTGPNYEDNPYLLPDIAVEVGQGVLQNSVWRMQPMQTDKFTRLFRGMLLAIGVPAAEAKKLSARSLRKVLPTMGQNFGIPSQAAESLGNWQDKPPGRPSDGHRLMPMSTLYALNKVSVAGENRLRIVAGMAAVSKRTLPQHVDYGSMPFLQPQALTSSHVREAALHWESLATLAAKHGSDIPASQQRPETTESPAGDVPP